MRDDERIEGVIRAVLDGSQLPVDRRVEVADELRGHLDQLVESKVAAGCDWDDAVGAAVGAFGRPELIRKQLCRQQRSRDKYEAAAVVRGLVPAMVVVGAFVAATVFILGEGLFFGTGLSFASSIDPFWRVVAAVTMFGTAVAAMVPGVCLYGLCRVRMRQRFLRDEVRVRENVVRWMLQVVCVIAVSQVILGGGVMLVGMAIDAGSANASFVVDWGRITSWVAMGMFGAWGFVGLVAFVVGVVDAVRQRRLGVVEEVGVVG